MIERTNPPQPVRIALAGLGAIGLRVAQALDEGIPGHALAAVAARDKRRASERLARLGRPVPVVDIDALEPLAPVAAITSFIGEEFEFNRLRGQ